MEGFIKGDIVVVPFPFSDLTGKRRRPALVITNLKGDDLILCQITATRSDQYSISLTDTDFKKGSLKRDSFIRPNKIFTADIHIIIRKIGNIKKEKIREVIDRIIQIIKL